MNRFTFLIFIIVFFLSGCLDNSKNEPPVVVPPVVVPPVVVPPVVEPPVALFSNSQCSNWSDPDVQGIVSSESAFNGALFERAIDLESFNGNFYIASRKGKIFVSNLAGSEISTLIDLAAYIGSANNDNSQQWGITSIAISDDFYADKKLFVAINGKMAGDTKVTSRILVMNFTNDLVDIDRGSITVVIREQQNTPWHQLGQIAYGEKGNLFAGFGDGGQEHNASNLDSVKGKILRLHINENLSTTIPIDNPVIENEQSFIYAYGVRNPWRFSIDKVTDKIWLGDVGRLEREEINIIEAGGNYGWPSFEGTVCREDSCEGLNVEMPYYEYGRDEGVAVMGGFVYRGSRIDSLYGTYIYRDVLGTEHSFLTKNDRGELVSKLLTNPGFASVSAYAEDENGELYFFNPNGNYPIKTFVPLKNDDVVTFKIPELLSNTGCVNMSSPDSVSLGLLPYVVNSKLWSDGAIKHRSFNIPQESEISISESEKFEFSPGSILVKTFERDNKVIETRLLVRHLQGHWTGYTYEWNQEQTDAKLLSEGKTVSINSSQWSFPSRKECFSCHTDNANANLGIEVNQVMPDGIKNDFFNELIPYIPSGITPGVPLYSLSDTASEELKARSYLHSNCSGCHNPSTSTPSNIDFRYTTHLSEMSICNIESEHQLDGEVGGNLLEVGNKENSSIYKRLNRVGDGQMPPLGRHQIDLVAVEVIGSWIDNIVQCD